MALIVVDVMPKAEILDPQGKAVTRALARLGHEAVGDVRVGKRFELRVEGEVTDALLEQVRTVSTEVLANTVIEDVVGVTVVEEAAQAGAAQ
ncbi:phosphoribosylformylglycinamidine synthase subunit PurS [Agrococcus sp. ARC_14]|uniref:phosphoribosylformylglycinamidine synthase subunit PurS n=1 Tax=Agrococcus sp. ARC_14 TaxID=2919927 RepID=UPI001F070693|nr:phosphoribosylformylglycinamidine synthase subunit PurS [Agrococcus sp. ARC_14]MCH1882030.1 phosphoribosylformylglycinamidine synthase subunit PurS [Agrococcus sp. ARC_14]